VRVMKGVETEDFMQARRSVQMPGGGGGDPRILQVNEPNARFKTQRLETGVYLHLQAKRTQFGPVDRASPCLRRYLKTETESSLRNVVF
jgi:hypothetical protein